MISVKDGGQEEAALLATAVRRQLYARRYALGLSQREVARRMGTTQSVVSELETGVTKDPGLGTLTRYAAALEMRLAVSLERDQPGREERS